MVYGADRVGLKSPSASIRDGLFELTFRDSKTTEKLQDFNGVILFQSTFETHEAVRGNPYSFSGPKLRTRYDRDELMRRVSEASQLIEKGGFICFLIHEDFVEWAESDRDLKETDLSKIYSNFDGLFRKNLGGDSSITKIYRPEFEQFLKNYGVARVQFDYYSEWLESNIKKICNVGYRGVAGFVIFGNRYFIPCRLPAEHEIEDFFTKLSTALVSTAKKLRQDVPGWLEEFRFPNEQQIINQEAELRAKLDGLVTERECYTRYKRCLCYDGELLVESVANILNGGLGLKVAGNDEDKIEDKVLFDDQGKEIALIEIKGSNQNVSSADVYQADMHKGRREKPDNFPSVLIVNTFIKRANSMDEKRRDVSSEQIRMAVKRSILILRTVDLVCLVHLKEGGRLNLEQLVRDLTSKAGWLKVSEEGYEVVMS